MATSNLAVIAQGLPQNVPGGPGIISGHTAGLQLADYIDNMDRARRMDDISYLSEQNKYENEMADNPLKEAERLLKLSQAQATQETFDSGLAQEAQRTELQDKIDAAIAKRGERAVTEMKNHADLAVAANNEASSGMMSPDRYEFYRKQFAANGMKLPANPLEGMKIFSQIAKNAHMTKEHLAKIAEQENKAQLDIDAKQVQSADNKAMTQAMKDVAEIQAKNRGNTGSPEDQLMRELEKKSIFTPNDLLRSRAAIEADIKKSLTPQQIELMGKNATSEWQLDKKLKEKWPNVNEYIDHVIKQKIDDDITNRIITWFAGKTVIGTNGNNFEIKYSNRDKIQAVITGRMDYDSDVTASSSGGTSGATPQTGSKDVDNMLAKLSKEHDGNLDKMLADINRMPATNENGKRFKEAAIAYVTALKQSQKREAPVTTTPSPTTTPSKAAPEAPEKFKPKEYQPSPLSAAKGSVHLPYKTFEDLSPEISTKQSIRILQDAIVKLGNKKPFTKEDSEKLQSLVDKVNELKAARKPSEVPAGTKAPPTNMKREQLLKQLRSTTDAKEAIAISQDLAALASNGI